MCPYMVIIRGSGPGGRNGKGRGMRQGGFLVFGFKVASRGGDLIIAHMSIYGNNHYHIEWQAGVGKAVRGGERPQSKQERLWSAQNRRIFHRR